MKNETVLITGASSGIGLELARCFAVDGSRLVLTARNQAALENLAAELRQRHNVEIIVLAVDLSQPAGPKQIFDRLADQKVVVDVLVNNAGFGLHGPFAQLPLQKQVEMIQVNITSLAELTGLFLPAMVERGRGGVLNVGSVAGFVPGPGMGVYYATKAFVQSFSEALASELEGTGVSITVLCPGPTETNFGAVARGNKVRVRQTGKMTAETVARSGHDAFRRQKVIAVPGVKNQALVFLTRIMPRHAVRTVIKSYNTFKE